MIRLLSFDIDYTLEVGEPPGPVTLAMVRRALELGYHVGSCSDRPLGWQQEFWASLGIEPAFVGLKHRMQDLRDTVKADEYTHVGVSDGDRRLCQLAGFRFQPAGITIGLPWATRPDGTWLPPNTENISPAERARIEGDR